jgi:hypothetical protein
MDRSSLPLEVVCDAGPIIHIHGTIGILLRAIRRSQRTPAQVLALLQSIPQQSSLHIRADLLEEIKAQVRREFNLH